MMDESVAVIPDKIDQFVIPGDVIGRFTSNVKLGPGLSQQMSNIIATKAGLLKHRAPNKYWIENKQKRVSLKKHRNDLNIKSV